MDRRDWHQSEDPAAMLEWAANKARFRSVTKTTGPQGMWPPLSDRKMRLFACACCEHYGVDTDIDPERDRIGDDTAWAKAWCHPSMRLLGREEPGIWSYRTERYEPDIRCQLLREIIGDPWEPLTIREEVPSRWPGRVYVFQPTWLTSSVLALARVAYDQQDWSALGPLSDALEEAGCSCQPLLMHLRGWEVCPYCMGTGGFQANSTWVPCEVCDPDDKPSDTIGWRPLRGPHARGCFAIDCILGQA